MFLYVNVTCETFAFTFSMAPSIAYENLINVLFHSAPEVYLLYVFYIPVVISFVFTFTVTPSVVYEKLINLLFHMAPVLCLLYVLYIVVTCETFVLLFQWCPLKVMKSFKKLVVPCSPRGILTSSFICNCYFWNILCLPFWWGPL